MHYKFRGINNKASKSDDLTMWVELDLYQNTIGDVVRIIEKVAHLYDQIQVMAKNEHKSTSLIIPISFYKEHFSRVAESISNYNLSDLEAFINENRKITDIEYDNAQQAITKRLRISTPWLQKKLAIDRDRALVIMVSLQKNGVVSAPLPNGKRTVLLKP